MRPTDQSLKPIAVIGAGATGLAAAYQLTRLGRRVLLFEASSRVGGAVRTELTDGWLIEAGPNTLHESHHETRALISELALENERVLASPAAKNRYIVRDGKLRAAPMSPFDLWSTELFSARTKRKLVSELWAKPQDRGNDVALAELITAHFGQEVTDYALNPIVSGIFAGDPTRLSTQHTFPQLLEFEKTHGSIIRGQRAQSKARKARGEGTSHIVSFRHGLQSLVNALAHRLRPGSIVLNATVENIRTALGAPWRVTWTQNDARQTEEFGAVVLALPAEALAKITFDSDARRPLAVLGEVLHPPLASLFLGFRREQIAHPLDGYGVLIPAVEKRGVLGVLFSSTLFPNRAPTGHVALTVMAGGSLHPEISRSSETDVRSSILAELRQLLGITGEPVFFRHNHWPRSIPQYELGYERFKDAIETCEQSYGGLYIGGQARNGISLQSCLRAGLTLGEKAAR
ncbi:MAG: protoporphyrinogen oxidase [Nibricoccus sp.]